jgi:hypothetical protein
MNIFNMYGAFFVYLFSLIPLKNVVALVLSLFGWCLFLEGKLIYPLHIFWILELDQESIVNCLKHIYSFVPVLFHSRLCFFDLCQSFMCTSGYPKNEPITDIWGKHFLSSASSYNKHVNVSFHFNCSCTYTVHLLSFS